MSHSSMGSINSAGGASGTDSRINNMETMVDVSFWRGRRVFLTGHTGFKGSWLSLWLHQMGAHVTGYSLAPEAPRSMYELCSIDQLVSSHIGDIRDAAGLHQVVAETQPEIIIHMAAQPLVLESYARPADTYSVNVIGTVHVLEAVRQASRRGAPVKAVINVTTDKVYDNMEWDRGYRESEPLGGYDPYSSSKACSELVTAAYRSSYYHPDKYPEHGVAIATARAGNVIGGGDWSKNRLIPDIIAAISSDTEVLLRHPGAIRPWQHVLEPLSGYLLLAQKLVKEGARYASAWNFGPNEEEARTVEEMVRLMYRAWGKPAALAVTRSDTLHEHRLLRLDCAKAKKELGWRPAWNVETTVDRIVEWVQAHQQGADMRTFTLDQIRQYMGLT